MTEPLGRSQVLEYLIDLSSQSNIYLISFERENNIENIEVIKNLINTHNIKWRYFIYSNKYGLFSTLNQIIKAVRFSSYWIKKNNINIIHARSMIPATMGLILKKQFGLKLLFDIRGFAIDEKVDSGRLKKQSLVFYFLKKLDNYLYLRADHVVTLTLAAKEILHNDLAISTKKITVIPTCASRDIFKLASDADKIGLRKSLSYNQSDIIIIHTGTVSGWYDFDSEVLLIKEMMRQDETIHFLILNKNEQSFIHELLKKHELPEEKINVTSCSFDNMYQYLGIADASIFFIHPSYSKQASAPTKFAENVACHLPSVTNGNVGDMSHYLQQYDVAYLVDLPSLKDSLVETANKILEKISHQDFTQSDFSTLFNEHFDKKIAIDKYQQIYETIS